MSNPIKCLLLWWMVASLILGGVTAFAREHGGTCPAGFKKGEKKGWGESKTPPGWSKGKKKGWKEAGAPPGLARKGKN